MRLNGRERGRTGLEKTVAFLATALVHGVLVAGILFQRNCAPEEAEAKPPDPMIINADTVQIARLGVERPPDQLPRLYNPPEHVEKEDVVNINKKAREEVEKKPVEKKEPKKRRTKKKQNLDDVIKRAGLHDPNRPVTSDLPTGNPNGSAWGNTDGPGSGDPYIADILVEIKSQWRVPRTIHDDKLNKLKAVVWITIDSGGRITSWKFMQTSRNATFDDSITRTLDSYMRNGPNRLPKPPKKFALQRIKFGFKGAEANR